MKAKLFAATAALGASIALVGCGGSGHGHDSGQSSTVAPSTSTTKPKPKPSPTPSKPAPKPTPAPSPSPSPSPGLINGNPDAVVASVLLDQISVCDMNQSSQIATIPVGKQPSAVATLGSFVYVANAVDQSVSIVDLMTNQVTTTMDATAPGVASGIPIVGTLIGPTIDPILKPLVRPTGICVMPNGLKCFTANLINVTSYDLGNDKPLNSIFGLNLNIGNLVTAITSGNLSSFLNVQTLAGLGEARCACDNKTVFVTNMVTGNVTVIDATDDQVITNTPVGKIPVGVAVAAGKGYVACVGTGDIWILDEVTGAVKSTFKAPGQVPVDVTASPTGDKVYVANFLGGDITVIDTVTDLPVNTIPAGLSIAQLFTSLGVPIPASASGGLSGALQGFLSGFLGGSGGNLGSSGLGGLLGGNSPIGPNQLMSGIMSAFLGFAGISQSTLQGMNMPGIGVISLSVAADGSKVAGANLMFGMTVTDIATQIVSGPQFMTGQGMGASGVACCR